jgi:hypothetical protein
LTVVSAQRPQYEFSDTVFEDLPEYPDDLLEIRDLFAQNKINITQIPSQYYLQPEFYQSWSEVCNRLYKEDRKYHGIYGFNIYPSLYTIYAEKNQTFSVTAFLNSNFGIEVKTGIGINLSYDQECVYVELVEPFFPYSLLNETYPKFTIDWSEPLVLDIKVLKNKNSTIQVFNTKPPDYMNELWKSTYGTNYATTEKFSRDIPKLTIEIITPTEEEQNVVTIETDLPWLLIIIVGTIFFIFIALGVHRVCTKRKLPSR